MTIVPRYYQRGAVDAVTQRRKEGITRPVVILPTGTGKSVIVCMAHRELRLQGETRPTLYLAHVGELLDQIVEKFNTIDPRIKVSKEKAGERASQDSDVIVGSIQSLYGDNTDKLSWADFGLIVVDECHHYAGDGIWTAVLDRLADASSDTLILGLTATPNRMDKRSIVSSNGKAAFQDVVYVYTIKQAMTEGYWCSIRALQVKTLTNIDSVRKRGGEFVEKDLSLAIDNDERTKLVYEAWVKHCKDRTTIAFCADVEHARHFRDFFHKQGVKTEYISGKHTDWEKKSIINGLRSGEITVVSNARIFGEGIDVPNISCVIIAAPMNSEPRYLQAIGRGTRPAPNKKDLIILDTVDVTTKHNIMTASVLIDLPRGVDLEGESLKEVAEELEESGINENILTETKPKSLRELRAVVKEINLLTLISTPEEVQGYTQYRWLPIRGNKYLLCGYNKTVTVEIDALNHVSTVFVDNGKSKRVKTNLEPEVAFPLIEQAVASKWTPYDIILVSRGNEYEDLPMSRGQKMKLTSLGVNHKLYPGMSMADATNLINYKLAMGSKSTQPHWVKYKRKKK